LTYFLFKQYKLLAMKTLTSHSDSNWTITVLSEPAEANDHEFTNRTDIPQ